MSRFIDILTPSNEILQLSYRTKADGLSLVIVKGLGDKWKTSAEKLLKHLESGPPNHTDARFVVANVRTDKLLSELLHLIGSYQFSQRTGTLPRIPRGHALTEEEREIKEQLELFLGL